MCYIKGFTQQPRIDYNETFALVARLDTVRTMSAIVGHHKWKVTSNGCQISFFEWDIIGRSICATTTRLSDIGS